MIEYFKITAQIIIALSIYNVWFLRFNKTTVFRAKNAKNMKEEFIAYGLPYWFVGLIGFLKVSLATILVVGIFIDYLVFPAAIGMAILMFFAILMHIKVKDELLKSLPAAIFLTLSLLIAFLETNDSEVTETEDLTESSISATINNDHYKLATARIESASESSVNGTVELKDSNGTVYLIASISGLSPGEHAIHIHEFGDCSSEDAKSAGGHWNPTNVNHGEWDKNHFHLGDIGNILADSNGYGEISMNTKLWCISCKDSIKNITGKSIIIHKGADDFHSQPSGAAGARVGCGVISLLK
jgi:Cu-Zn family superoxide dismutase